MRRCMLLMVLLVLIGELGGMLEAQNLPTGELYGGFSYANTDLFSTNKRAGLTGWEGSLGVNLGSRLALVADFGGDYGTSRVPVLVPTPFPTCPPFCPTSVTDFSVDTKLYTFLFGMRVPYRKWEKFTPFGQALFGRAHVSGNVPGFSEIDSKFSYALGAGGDYTISPRLAWRVQVDYLRTRFFKGTQDNVRVSTGIVLHFTRKKKQRTLTTP